MNQYEKYCAPGVGVNESMVPVSEDVSLRVVQFSPPVQSKFPPVIFVPGWITQMDAWQTVLHEMTKDFTIYYVETREKISSSVHKRSEISVHALGHDLVALVDHFQLEAQGYIFAGSSLGATAILESCKYARKAPLCMALIGPNASFHIPKAGLLFIKPFPPALYLGFKPYIKWYLKTFRLDSDSDYAQYQKYCRALDAADPYKLKKMALSMPDYAVWDFIGEIEFPTLLVGASKDLLHDDEIIRRMADQMKNGTYLDLETNAQTHSKVMVDEIRAYVEKFLC